ncbi:hypothetical protein PG987_011674 [Apiospora arundinis]
MKSFSLLAAALLLANGLASPTGHDQEPSDPATPHAVAIRDGNEWTLPETGNPSPKQMENLVNNYERLGLCLSWEGSTDWDARRTTGLCAKYCEKNPGGRKGRGGRGRRDDIPAIGPQEWDHDEQVKKLKGVSCVAQQDINGKALYRPDENGHRWTTGVCECDAPQIAKEITVFVAEGFHEFYKACLEGLKQLCAAGFAVVKGIIEEGISWIPYVGVYVRGARITAKMVKAAKTAYQHGKTGNDFFDTMVKDACGAPPPFDFSLEGLFMALVELPDSALADDALIACKLEKKACKKLEKVTDPKKPKIIYPGKNHKQQEDDLKQKEKEAEAKKNQEAEAKKHKDAEAKKHKDAEAKKNQEAEAKKNKEAEAKKNKNKKNKDNKKKPDAACKIGAICNGQH